VRILIAGIGNIFHGDDAFGVEVAGRLSQRNLPPEARVVDFGIRGFDLAYALLDGYDVTILVDATSRGGPPGTLYTIEIDVETDGNAPSGLDEPRIDLATRGVATHDVATHGMNPMRVLQLAKAMGGGPPYHSAGRVLLVACEPETLGSEDEGQMGLSATVAAAVDTAADMVEALVGRILQENRGVRNAGAAA
jgi:hydrogenase maturation protease